jgi:hypothetical protein
MPSPLKNDLVLKDSDEGIVVEWWPTPRWHILEVYLSIILTLLGWCIDGDDALSGIRLCRSRATQGARPLSSGHSFFLARRTRVFL